MGWRWLEFAWDVGVFFALVALFRRSSLHGQFITQMAEALNRMADVLKEVSNR